jgi:hypothetical protein
MLHRAVSASLSRCISSILNHKKGLTEGHGDEAVLLMSTPKVTSKVDLIHQQCRHSRHLPQRPDGIDPQDKQHRLRR